MLNALLLAMLVTTTAEADGNFELPRQLVVKILELDFFQAWLPKLRGAGSYTTIVRKSYP